MFSPFSQTVPEWSPCPMIPVSLLPPWVQAKLTLSKQLQKPGLIPAPAPDPHVSGNVRPCPWGAAGSELGRMLKA